ncbi:MAG: hypothetical protein PHW64_04115 [Sulfuricurvum sp.]|nr:hypothetical protein [Sulfuricurvum sp.]
MFNGIKDSIKAKLYDFAYTPFMSSYVISWILFNHKYLLVYFSGSTLDNKLQYLEKCHIEFLFPLYIALIYVFIYPALALIFYYATLWYNKQSMAIKQRIEDETPVTQEQARELKHEHYKLADERDKALDKLKEKEKEHTEVLENALKPLQNEIEAYKVAANVSNTMIDSLKAEREDMIMQHDTATNTYKKTISELEQQITNLKLPAYVVANDPVILKEPIKNIPIPLASTPKEDDRTKILRFFYESNYKTKLRSNVLDAIVDTTKMARPKATIILADLIKENILLSDQYDYISITDIGNKTLLNLFDKSIEI